MESDTPLVVNLEVAVPHIVLSALKSQDSSRKAAYTEQAGASEHDDMVEQVRLLTPGSDQPPHIAKDMSERITYAVKFRMFRLSLPWIGRPTLLQVLRGWKSGSNQNSIQGSTIKIEQEDLYVTEASAFSLEFRRRGEGTETTLVNASGYVQPAPLQAGLNRVVIYLDSEGMPASYSIDGAES